MAYVSAFDHISGGSAASSVGVSSNSNWKWECSDEIRKALESMGLYELVKSQHEVIATSASKRDIDLAKLRLDALSKSMAIMKSSASVYKDSGAEDDQKGISTIEVFLRREDE